MKVRLRLRRSADSIIEDMGLRLPYEQVNSSHSLIHQHFSYMPLLDLTQYIFKRRTLRQNSKFRLKIINVLCTKINIQN